MMISERLQLVINEMFGGNKSEFSRIVGITPTTLNNYLSKDRKSKPSSDVLENILNKVNINAEWLVQGIGSMIKSNEIIEDYSNIKEIKGDREITKAIELGMKLIPEVTFKFSAGDRLVVSNEEIIRYWGLPDCTGEECVVTVDGLSMLPIIPPGAKVLLKPIGFSVENPNTIPFGEVFGVIVEDDCTGMYHGHIKKLRRHKTNPDKYWIAQSFNPEFDDFDILLNKVRGLWVVKKHIVDDFK